MFLSTKYFHFFSHIFLAVLFHYHQGNLTFLIFFCCPLFPCSLSLSSRLSRFSFSFCFPFFFNVDFSIVFRNILKNLEDWGYISDPFQFSNLLQLLNDQSCQDSSVSLCWKGEWGTIKNDNCQLLKMDRSHYIAIFIKS